MVIFGHRGARGEAPKNTAGGFAYALEKGVRHFELDLRLSADNIPMVIHDASRRTCGESMLVANSPAAVPGSLDAASGEQWSPAAGKVTGTRVAPGPGNGKPLYRSSPAIGVLHADLSFAHLVAAAD